MSANVSDRTWWVVFITLPLLAVVAFQVATWYGIHQFSFSVRHNLIALAAGFTFALISWFADGERPEHVTRVDADDE